MSRSRPSQPRSLLRLLAPPLPHGHERRRQTPLRRPMASRLACALAVTVDYRIYHAINQFVYHHAWLGRGLNALEKWAVPVIAVATFALWLLARPGGTRKWKLASACALGSAALALLINQVIGKLWHRQRPFAAHPAAHVWGSRSHDPLDVLAGCLVGLASALLLARVASPLIDRLVGLVERATDPLLAPLWRLRIPH